MEHLTLEIFDLNTANGKKATTSKYAYLPEDASITITDTSEIFENGDVWSHSFTLNVHANSHIFGTSGEIHGSRLHEQINKRRARLWVEGLPLYLGYLKLDDEVEVDEDGNVDVTFESGQKTFDEMIDDTKAREVSVGDVVIGVALNRKRVSVKNIKSVKFKLDELKGLAGVTTIDEEIKKSIIDGTTYVISSGMNSGKTPYVQQWPKLVKSKGKVYDSGGVKQDIDYTNVQHAYDTEHPFCNINICYQKKVFDDNGEEKVKRGYTKRLAYSSNDTTDGGDNQTRFNNAPNFYLLYFIDRLFKDLNIHVDENQMKDVEDLRRVFMLNYGCHYEEIEGMTTATGENYLDTTEHLTPSNLTSRYEQWYMPIMNNPDDTNCLVKGWAGAGQFTHGEAKGLEHPGKVLMRNASIYKTKGGTELLSNITVECTVTEVQRPDDLNALKSVMHLDGTSQEISNDCYSAYLAYATGDNYPDVDISEIVEAMKSMFGVRFLFSDDYKRVRIVLLRNIFQSQETQTVSCDIISETKTENCIRGFRMTYGKGTEDTTYYYKGFNDLFPRQTTTWKDTTDKHDYSQWEPNADYGRIKQNVSPSNKRCYITPVNGNAYGVKVDEDEDVLFPSLFELAGYMDAEDGDCSGDSETIHEVQCGASPVIMNEVDGAYFSLFSGDLSAPAPEVNNAATKDADWDKVKQWRSTYACVLENFSGECTTKDNHYIRGYFDVYVSEGFRMRLLDNYSVGNGGTPFDEADTGLQFGIMRGSGADAGLNYWQDPDDGEGNDTWDITPGGGAIDHPDTCDSYGNLWDYNGSGGSVTISTAVEAKTQMAAMWPKSNFNLVNRTSSNYLRSVIVHSVMAADGKFYRVLMALMTNEGYIDSYGNITTYIAQHLQGKTVEEMYAEDKRYKNILIEVDSSRERGDTLKALQKLAFAGGSAVTIDGQYENGVGSLYGRFSLKLRAEKPNPYFNTTKAENSSNPRYLTIENSNLRNRGLADQFYKEYSYWVRNARIANIEAVMTMAQLLAIDKTKRVTIGDVTGFIRKMQYSVSSKTGLGNVTMEVMYI